MKDDKEKGCSEARKPSTERRYRGAETTEGKKKRKKKDNTKGRRGNED